MAKQQSNINQTRTVVKGLIKDTDPSFIQDGMWIHARNAVNNTREGDVGTLSNEESNALCGLIGSDIKVPNNVVIIGAISLFESKWVIYSAIYDGSNNKVITSEIGLFEEEFCRYRPIVRDKCLKFTKFNLVSGASREKPNCTWQVYWADGNNPDRYLNIGDPRLWPSNDYVWLGGLDGTATINYYSNGTDTKFLWPGVAWEEICVIENTDTVIDPENNEAGCIICTSLNKLNCDKIRLASLVKTPCVDLSISPQNGTLINGSYTIGLSYSINDQSVTNFFSLSYIQPVYNEFDGQGSLEVNIKDLDTENFDQYQLCVAYISNSVEKYKILGFYSINTNKITLDQIPDSLEDTSPSEIFKQNPVIETSEQITEANRYLLKIGPKSKFDFNYQPLANLIGSEWVSVEYPERYYVNGGKNAGYLRDEVYSFFIRWLYDTGDKSSSYHIPGRSAVDYDGLGLENGDYADANSFDGDTRLFETINTATIVPQIPNLDNGDGGKVIAYGNMGYWQSSERYPSNKPEIWNSSYYCWTHETSPQYDLCGTPIRHHRFPDNGLAGQAHHFVKKTDGSYHIRLMGVRFKNITLPKDNDGNDIEGIVGYEILRGSRQGNKSIVAKGMVNNFRDYQLQGTNADNPSKIGLYANYPFNCIRPDLNSSNDNNFNFEFNDPFILSRTGEQPLLGDDSSLTHVNQNIPTDMLSFHSPDTFFKTPYLQMSEMKVYGYLKGQAEQRFTEPLGHPEFKLLADFIVLAGVIGGVVKAIFASTGDIKINYPAGKWEPQWVPNVTGGDKDNKPAYKWGIVGVPGVSINGGTSAAYGGDDIPAANIDTHVITNEPDPISGDPQEILGNQLDYDAIESATVGNPPNANDVDPDGIQDEIESWNAFNQVFLNGGSIDDKLTEINQEIYKEGKYLTTPTIDRNYTASDVLPQNLTANNPALSGLAGLTINFLEGLDGVVNLLKSIAPYRQYALEQIGHGDYNEFKAPNLDIFRYSIEDGIYVFKENQDFPEYLDSNGNSRSYRINNINRPIKPVLRVTTPNGTQQGPDYIQEGTQFVDQSLMTLDYAAQTFDVGSSKINYKEEGKEKPFINDIASYYVGLKFNIKNQYGQLNTIPQVIATPCEQKIDFNSLGQTSTTVPNCPNPLVLNRIQESSVFFGGDTYINRFTQKNIMPFFTTWLYNKPRGSEFNYFLVPSVPFPKFWANSFPWDIQDISPDNIIAAIIGGNNGSGLLPSSYYNLDNENYNTSNNNTVNYPGIITPKNSYFYLAACGISDFFVESDVIVDFRNRGDMQKQYHYDKYRYTDLLSLFDANPEVLTAGDFNKYDYSLSISQFFINQFFTLGALQGTNYDPTVAEICFVSQPNVINYSLPETQESLIESWRTFLPLNRVVFKNDVNSVKSYAKTGMIVTFEDASPLMYGGVDQREDYIGVAATVGDGLLFSATPRNVTAADSKYEYGSAQDRLGVISTPLGLYYISQQQGKIFSFGDSLQEISSVNMKWWFEEFLPYKLTEDFPDFPHIDNPVAGIGCSAGYDNSNGIIYFSKKDYFLKPEYKGKVEYLTADKFSVLLDDDPTRENKITVKLGDTRIFEDASWTISYDPKNKQWISFHDWHPNLYLSGRNKHYTTKSGSIWEQNAGCNDYCNFYNVQFPFEIGIPFPTGQAVTTVRSIEYLLECFKRDSKFCVDQYHILDYNFDQAVIFNSEQVSGYLNLNIVPKNNIALAQKYPKINVNSIDILVSKEEQKYRFNQFWDITDNRGEFPDGAGYPPTGQLIPDTTRLLGNYTENQIWQTEANGYIQTLNPVNLNYNKPQLQRKKFRHYNNFVRLIKKNSQDANMAFRILNTKNQISQR